jgi:hypothetical protein
MYRDKFNFNVYIDDLKSWIEGSEVLEEQKVVRLFVD